MSIYPRELADAGRPTVWLSWYFKQGAFTIITAPLFLFLVYALITASVGSIVQIIALFRVSFAVWGLLGLLVVICGAWIPVILPPALYYSLLKNLPGLWIRPDAARKTKVIFSIGIAIVWPLAAHLLIQGTALGIGWVADRDPCAAFSAGVTGSMPPTNCN